MPRKDQKIADSRPRCGSTETANGKPCRQIALPCRFHGGKGRPITRRRRPLPKGPVGKKFVEGILRGKNPTRAAIDAGAAWSTAAVQSCDWVQDPYVKARIARRQKEAEIETNEIIGNLVHLSRHDLSDVLPENEILAAARERGVSGIIKEIEVTERFIANGYDEEGNALPPDREVKTKVKIESPLAVNTQLCKVFGLEELPAPSAKAIAKFESAIERFMQRAQAAGIEVTREEAEAQLAPLFRGSVIGPTNAVN